MSTKYGVIGQYGMEEIVSFKHNDGLAAHWDDGLDDGLIEALSRQTTRIQQTIN